MCRRGKIGIQINRLSFPRKIVELSPCNRLPNFLIDVLLKRHGLHLTPRFTGAAQRRWMMGEPSAVPRPVQAPGRFDWRKWCGIRNVQIICYGLVGAGLA